MSGTPVQASGGEMSCPSNYLEGIGLPSANADDVKRRVMLISSAQRLVLARAVMITAAARNWVVRMSTLISQYRSDHDLTWL